MLIKPITPLNQSTIPCSANNNNRMTWKGNNVDDKFSRSAISSPQISYENGQKIIKGISFGGKIPNIKPSDLLGEKPALQMKVTGVTNFQAVIKKLSDSAWKDGQKLVFETDVDSKKGEVIKLFTQNHEQIGRVPDEITPAIYQMLAEHPNNFKFELSNIIAGNTPSAPTTGLRVNLLFTGDHKKAMESVQEAFDTVLNDTNASQKLFFFQPPKTTDEVLKQIYKNIEKEHGAIKGKEIVEGMKKSISTIVNELESPDNKKILLMGHCKPDGDTLGSVNGLSQMLQTLFPEKQIDCAIADEIPSVFRNNIPGMEKIKHPYSEEQISKLEAKLADAIKNSETEEDIKAIKESLEMAKNPDLLLKDNQKYDAVMLMDVPSPARFTSAFKNWIEGAKTVMYVDHHPLELDKWDQVKGSTGVDMSKIIKNNCSWIADQVAAAAQQTAILASKLKPKENPLNPDNYIKTVNSGIENQGLDNAVKSFVTGIWTDTSGFSRTANLLTKDIKDEAGNPVPIQNRPNYFPEGMSKWMFSLTNGRADKKWFHDNLNFVLKYREQMIENLLNKRHSNADIGFGYTKASFDETKDILQHAQQVDPNTNFHDVVNEMKLSEVMNELKESTIRNKMNPIAVKLKEAPGPFDNDKIAVFISESEKAGELNTEGVVSKNNALRFSFRSADGSSGAELLASLFNGGGHGPAAGGHLVGKDITADSTFKVFIDGKPTRNAKEVFETLQKNFDIKHDANIKPEDVQKLTTKIEVLEDKNGQKPEEIMEDVVKEMRMQNPAQEKPTEKIEHKQPKQVTKNGHHQKTKKRVK